MKRKIAVSFLIMALVCALVGGATFALFTSTASNDGNTFGAGTVVVKAGESDFTNVVIDNMAPGDTINGSFVVENAGTLDIWFKVIANASGALFKGDTPAQVTIDSYIDALAAGASATINYSVYLPLGANNDYQDVDGALNFTVNAVQSANNSDKAGL